MQDGVRFFCDARARPRVCHVRIVYRELCVCVSRALCDAYAYTPGVGVCARANVCAQELRERREAEARGSSDLPPEEAQKVAAIMDSLFDNELKDPTGGDGADGASDSAAANNGLGGASATGTEGATEALNAARLAALLTAREGASTAVASTMAVEAQQRVLDAFETGRLEHEACVAEGEDVEVASATRAATVRVLLEGSSVEAAQAAADAARIGMKIDGAWTAEVAVAAAAAAQASVAAGPEYAARAGAIAHFAVRSGRTSRDACTAAMKLVTEAAAAAEASSTAVGSGLSFELDRRLGEAMGEAMGQAMGAWDDASSATWASALSPPGAMHGGDERSASATASNAPPAMVQSLDEAASAAARSVVADAKRLKVREAPTSAEAEAAAMDAVEVEAMAAEAAVAASSEIARKVGSRALALISARAAAAAITHGHSSEIAAFVADCAAGACARAFSAHGGFDEQDQSAPATERAQDAGEAAADACEAAADASVSASGSLPLTPPPTPREPSEAHQTGEAYQIGEAYNQIGGAHLHPSETGDNLDALASSLEEASGQSRRGNGTSRFARAANAVVRHLQSFPSRRPLVSEESGGRTSPGLPHAKLTLDDRQIAQAMASFRAEMEARDAARVEAAASATEAALSIYTGGQLVRGAARVGAEQAARLVMESRMGTGALSQEAEACTEDGRGAAVRCGAVAAAKATEAEPPQAASSLVAVVAVAAAAADAAFVACCRGFSQRAAGAAGAAAALATMEVTERAATQRAGPADVDADDEKEDEKEDAAATCSHAAALDGSAARQTSLDRGMAAAEQTEALIAAAVRAASTSGSDEEAAIELVRLAHEQGVPSEVAAVLSVAMTPESAAVVACASVHALRTLGGGLDGGMGGGSGGGMDGGLGDGMGGGMGGSGTASAAAAALGQGDALLASAIVANQSAAAGSSTEMAAKAAAKAAVAVASGSSLLEVQEAAMQTLPQVPGWSLTSWLSSLSFDALVSEAILKRVHENVPAGRSVQNYEQAFVCKLGEMGSFDTVLALLKETPLLQNIAQRICDHAVGLAAEMRDARESQAEEERLEAEADAREQRRRESVIKLEAWRKQPKQRWRMAKAAVLDNGSDKPGMSMQNVAEKMNESMIKSGAFTLSYSCDAQLVRARVSLSFSVVLNARTLVMRVRVVYA